MPSFLTYQWTGAEPRGNYILFNLATKAGAVTDVLRLATAPFSFR